MVQPRGHTPFTGSVPAAAALAAIKAIKAVVDAILVDTSTTLETKLDAIKVVADALEGKLDGASGLAAVKAVVDAILVDTGTTLEGKLDTLDLLADAIKAVTDNIPDGGLLTALLASIASILTDTEATIPGLLATIQADLDSPDQYKANVAALALEATLTAIKGAGWTTQTLVAIKAAIDAITGAVSTDWKGSFNWDTSAYTNVEQDISALFSTNLALTTRRKYSVKLDLTAVEADASFVSLHLAVKEKIDGTNYRAIDRKTVLKADIGSAAEPGIIIDIPATSENIQITMQMSTALAGDATIYYAVVKEHLE